MRDLCGVGHVLTGAEAMDFAHGWSALGTPLAIVRPGSVEQVSAVVKACRASNVPVVPWGGRTGLVGGGCADDAVAISLDRMNAVEEVHATDGTMRVQAGCIVQAACEAAEAEGLLLPLDLGARGSATIGGCISTNAGGNRVVRFGMMRDLVLGVEAVLADGSIVSALHPLIKNNTGYDLKQLFIGSEGTLGIVTRAVIRLRPKPASHNVALVAVDRFEAVTTLLRTLERRLGGQLCAFEIMWPLYYELVTTPPARGRPPLPHGAAHYVLIEAMGSRPEEDQALFEGALAEVLEQGLVSDAVIAQSDAQRAELWAIRDDGEQVSRLGPYVAFDVSVRLSQMERFSRDLETLVAARWPEARLVLFGHVGDGNLHVIVPVSENSPERRAAVYDAVLGLVSDYKGAISAEHGVGLDKKAYLTLSRSESEVAMMRTLKRALDPANILNPGKIIEMEG